MLPHDIRENPKYYCNHKFSREGVCLNCGYVNRNHEKIFEEFYKAAIIKFRSANEKDIQSSKK